MEEDEEGIKCGPQRGRENKAKGVLLDLDFFFFCFSFDLFFFLLLFLQRPPLFQGLMIVLLGEFDSPNVENLQELLELGGATVERLDSKAIRDYSDQPDSCVLVTDTIDQTGRESIKTLYHLRPVMSAWILDSIVAFELKDKAQYYEDGGSQI